MTITNERLQEPVIVIRYLWDNVIDCAMCDKKIAYTQAGPNYGVPWYQGPVSSRCKTDGGKTVCKDCFDKWLLWDKELNHDK